MGKRLISVGCCRDVPGRGWLPGTRGNPSVVKAQAGRLEPSRPTDNADNAQVLSGEVAVSPRISLFARVFDKNGKLVWEGWLENGTSAGGRNPAGS
jgi:hypothetical protein